MHFTKSSELDLKTKKAWEVNWRDISMNDVLGIFSYERVKKQMALMLRVLPKKGKILEGGCGLAPYLIRLRALGYDVEGIDYNEGPIRKILSYDPALPVKVGDVTAIPYPDDHFEGYLSLGVIEHFAEGPEKALREACRVLKKNGILYLAVPRNHLFMRLTWPVHFLKSLNFLRKIFKKSEDNHYWEQYFKTEDLKRYVTQAGFDVREIHPLDHSHAWVSFSNIFRDTRTYDEANALGLRLGRFCEKYLPWSTAAQMVFVCYKK